LHRHGDIPMPAVSTVPKSMVEDRGGGHGRAEREIECACRIHYYFLIKGHYTI
jgi:hypothetical protein